MSRPVFHSLSACAYCGVSGDEFASPNVEAWETLGEPVCDDCATEALEAAAESEVAAFLREIAEKVERLRGLYRVEEAA